MTRITLCLLTVGLLASCRDLSLSAPPGHGSVSGRVLLAEPGRPDKAPLPNAEVRVLGSGFATTTSPAGTFRLDDFEQSSGLLLVRADVAGVTRQRVVQLADFKPGPQRQVNLGDLVLGENARVRGRVLRADVSTAGGHSGTTVFVPAGPFTAYTNDDGSYSFDQMPEGPVELYAFRTGYEPATLGALSLRSGETVELRDFSLHVATSTAPGTLRGRLAFVPEASGPGDAAVRLVSTETSLSAPVQDDGSFRFSMAPVGLYRVIATRSGYGQLDVINVLVLSGGDADLGTLTLTTAPAFDAGVPPAPPDAGTTADAGMNDAGIDAGVDAGIDAGTDAGFDAGSGTTCASAMDCTVGTWCDPRLLHCVPLCVNDMECGFARVCDLASTHTCLDACTGNCGPGRTCTAQNVCRSICDGTFPCPGGTRCSAGACVPECTTNADCGNPFLACNFGSCQPNGLCATDPDCAREEMCTGGQCAQRPTAAAVMPDGGRWLDGGLVFPCSGACQCKSGERCLDGFCALDAVPTRFVALDAGGTGLSPSSPSGNLRGAFDGGQMVALLGNETWDFGTAPLSVPSNSHLAGGFVGCSATRWVRDASSRTTLTGVGLNTAGSAMMYAYSGVASQPLSNVRISGVTLRPTGTVRCLVAAGAAFKFVNGLVIEDVDLDLALTCGSGGVSTGLQIEDCNGVEVRRARWSGLSSTGGTGSRFLYFLRSQGLVEDVRTERLTTANSLVEGVTFDGVTGPTTLRRFFFSRFSDVPSNTDSTHIVANTCNGNRVRIEDGTMEFPNSLSPGNGGAQGIRTDTCVIDVARVRIDSSGHPGGPFDQNLGLELTNSSGTLSNLTIELPGLPAQGHRVAGLHFIGPIAAFQVSDVSITGTGGVGSDNSPPGIGMTGLRFEGIVSGPLSITRAQVSLKNNVSPHGILDVSSNLAAEVSVTDSRFELEGTNTCSADVIGALVRESLRIERSTFLVSKGAFVSGIYFAGGSGARLELYGNSVRVGSSPGVSGTCRSQGTASIFGSHALDIDVQGQLKAIGNTFESFGLTGQTGVSYGVACAGSPLLDFGSNIVATGRGSDVRLLTQAGSTVTGGCFSPAQFTSNYWFNGAATTLSAGERLYDAGISGNFFGGTTSCFAAPAVLADGGSGFPHYLAPASACADRGYLGVSTLGFLRDRDLFGQTRDAGAGPDIGAVEGP